MNIDLEKLPLRDLWHTDNKPYLPSSTLVSLCDPSGVSTQLGIPAPNRVRRAGFTLIEVMMAMAIVVVGVIGMMQAVTIGTETLDTSRKQQVGTQLVAAELERLRNGPWDTIANLPASATISINAAGVISGDLTRFALSNYTVAAGDDNTDLSTLARGFTCSFTMTRLRPTSATAATVTYVKLVYTVQWTSNTGRSHTRRTETYLGANGLHLSYQQA